MKSVKAKSEAVSKLTPSEDQTDLSHIPSSLAKLNVELKGSERVQGELRFTQAQEQAKELTVQYKLQMAAIFLENAHLELEMLYSTPPWNL